MRNRRFTALGIVLALGLTACGGGGNAPDETGQPVDISSLELSDAGTAGLDLYQAKCAACHMTDLSGGTGPSLGPGSAGAGKPIADLRTTITDGGGGMPAWGGLLSGQELSDILEFLSQAQGR